MIDNRSNNNIALAVKEKARAKERKHYTDEVLDDDEIEGSRTFSLEEKLTCHSFNANFVKVMKGEDFNLKLVQELGFYSPMVFYDKAGLGMRVPGNNFQVSDVKQCVGSRRNLDVMDVTTQKGMEMTMKEWCKYYENPKRDRLLNVISLEFSHTKLENYVESPKVVRQIDWIDTVWPRHLKECQTESTNIIEKMKYPKVQKYCLMSVGGCYTDFHIDFGGTSVWYHILHGEKIFWLIPPTERNFRLYEDWVLSGKQGDTFFGDQVEKCQRIHLFAGYTFMIPTGWIHAVYTPKDSLVFGGNFLHTFNVQNQLRVADVEDKTHVPQKFRYPFYGEISWYVLERYVCCMTGRSHRRDTEGEERPREETEDRNLDIDLLKSEQTIESMKNDPLMDLDWPQSPVLDEHNYNVNPRSPQSPLSFSAKSPVSPFSSMADVTTPLSPARVVDKMEAVPIKDKSPLNGNGESAPPSPSEKIAPSLPDCETTDVKPKDPTEKENERPKYLSKYEVAGLKALVQWLHDLPPNKKCIPKDIPDPIGLLRDVRKLLADHENDDQELACSGKPVLTWPESSKKPMKPKVHKTPSGPKPPKQPKSGGGHSGVRRRRTRCKKCKACTSSDCGECHFCKDMKKFGGPGKMKQSCISRQCMSPVLPNTAICMICGKDERIKLENTEETNTTLMECGICWEILHPNCLIQKYENLTNDGAVNEDLPNSWECPKCCHSGKQGQLKPRVPKGVSKLQLTSAKRTDSRQSSRDSDCSNDHLLDIQIEVDEVKSELDFDMELGQGDARKRKDFDSQDDVHVPKKKPRIDGDDSFRLKAECLTPRRGQRSRSNTPKPEERNSDFDSTPKRSIRTRKLEAIATSSLDDSLPLNSNGHSLPLSNGSDNDNEQGVVPQSQTVLPSPNEKRPYSQPDDQFTLKKIPKVVLERFVVRPAPIPPPAALLVMQNGKNHILERTIWMRIFSFLSPSDLCRCLRVCKTWDRWCLNRDLWSTVDVSKRKITQAHLIGIVRRQPMHLNLSKSNISRKQLSWLLSRLPHVKSIDLSGCSWSTISALCVSDCPLVERLDFSWSEGIKDSAIKELLTPNANRRPGIRDSATRLRKLTSLGLAGTDITDESLPIITRNLGLVANLDLSYCVRLTGEGINKMTKPPNCRRLTHLNLSGNTKFTSDILDYLKRCTYLVNVKFKGCSQITKAQIQKFSNVNKGKGYKFGGDKVLLREGKFPKF
ncbi:lysine-specific demethylase 2B-like isoform X2 [Lineus longissimus]|uniref:lysine-specific demethylase 2B-like isoform X2 n=1 Tax=Lineus longissimus TaxID=88925 RepID=UPI00315D0856